MCPADEAGWQGKQRDAAQDPAYVAVRVKARPGRVAAHLAVRIPHAAGAALQIRDPYDQRRLREGKTGACLGHVSAHRLGELADAAVFEGLNERRGRVAVEIGAEEPFKGRDAGQGSASAPQTVKRLHAAVAEPIPRATALVAAAHAHGGARKDQAVERPPCPSQSVSQGR